MRKKPLFILLLLLTCLGGVERLSHYLTDGFGLANISSNFKPNPYWDVEVSKEDLAETEKALSQTFHYLSSGSQSYVFSSEDGQFVIKFFKHKRWRLNPLFLHIPLSKHFEKKRVSWIRKKQETIHCTFMSSKLSYEIFKNETGVIYPHLSKTKPLQRLLLVKDRIGLKHKLDLDKIEFVIQKRAIPTDEYLLILRKRGAHLEAEEAVINLLNLTKERACLGYSDKDPHLIRNFGFIDGKAVQIDIGGFHKDPKKDFNYYQTKEIVRIENKILPWLKENYPELIDCTRAHIKEIKDY